MRIQTLIRRFFPAFAVGSVLFGTLAFAAVPAFAAEPAGPGLARPAVVGKVTSVSGDTLTVTSMPWHRGPKNPTAAQPTAYTVNASGATVTKGGKSVAVSSITIGDLVVVRGSVSGTTVTATAIREGMMHGPRGPRDSNKDASSTPAMPPIQGNGDPVIGGTVSALTGSTLTVTAKAGQTYTVDASAATVVKRGVPNAVLSNVSVGDAVVVQGTVNGTAVKASSVLDQGTPPSAGSAGSPPQPRRGFFGAIGGFFTRMFGFF